MPGERRGRGRYVLAGAGVLAAAMGLATWTSTDGLAAFGAAPQGARLQRMQASPRFQAGAFRNTTVKPVTKPGTTWSTTKEWLFGDQQRTPPGPLPQVKELAGALARAPDSGLRVTWLGHSTLLVELDGLRILTDPMWGERASPSTLAWRSCPRWTRWCSRMTTMTTWTWAPSGR